MKTVFNEEKELFFVFLWLLPLIPICAIFTLSLVNNHFSWFLLVVFFIWFIVFGYIYYCNHYVIVFQDDSFIIKHKKDRKIISYNDVTLVEKIKHLNNLKPNKYRIHFKGDAFHEKNVIVICNKLIQKQIRSILKDTDIVIHTIID